MLACYLVRKHGWTGDQAVKEIRRIRPGSIETYEQQDMVTTYHQHLKKSGKP